MILIATDSRNKALSDSNTSRFTLNMLEVMKAIIKGNNAVTTISKATGKATSNVSRTLNSLVKKGLVYKEKETRLYYLTPDGQKLLLNKVIAKSQSHTPSDSKTDSKPKKIRAHKVAVMISIKYKPKDWDRSRKQILTKKNISHTTGKLNNTDVVTHTFEEVTIKTTRDSIIVHLPKRHVYSPFEYWPEMFELLKEIVPGIERLYNIKLGQELTIISNEFADESGLIADATEEQDKYLVYHDKEDGLPRWQIDKSKGFKEWETLHPSLADTDNHRINEVLYDYAEHRKIPLPSTIAIRQESQEEQIRSLESNNITVSKILKELYKQTTALTEAVNLVRDMAFDPIEELKKKIQSEKDIQKYAEVIETLDEEKQAKITTWIKENIDI